MPPELTNARDRATPALALLSFTAGSMDAIAFLTLGEVFTSAMSGNTILLGLAIGQGRFGAALHSIAALVGYVVGVAIASLIVEESASGTARTLLLEAVFLVAFAALWLSCAGPVRPSILYSLIVLSAVAMGTQGAVGRAIGIPGIMTVIFTSTYTAIVGGFASRALIGQRPLLTGLARQQVTALSVYLGGASLAGIIATHRLSILPFVPLAAILVLLAGLRLRLLRLGGETS